MKIEIVRKISKNGKCSLNGYVDGRWFRWGACLSYAITGIKSKISRDGICTLSDKPLSCKIIRGAMVREFVLPILSLNQPVKEFEAAFHQRIEIYKDMKTWSEELKRKESFVIKFNKF
ncbi:MAG TPA: hypothetical protein ACFYD4_01820 [Candidatus Wunengus sp. YC61]|uniref:hypothetical protein n=1 Tax=Candidatus Wunengus sp. YC61 TaxID=3367698 RepID=UPI0040273607